MSAGVAIVPAGAKELLKTLTLPGPAVLAAYNWV